MVVSKLKKMEEIKINTGTYTFYKPQNLRGRPNNSIKGLLSQIRHIEKNEPKIFNTVFNKQGVCTTIDDLNILLKALIKNISSNNKTKTKQIYCRFSENEISFFKNELEKQVESKGWKKSFNSFISKIINTIIEQEKKVVDLRVFEDVKPSDKKKYYCLIPLKIYESPNVENPSLKKKLGASTTININESNFDWIESTCEITSLTKSDLIRKCLYSYRIKKEINESIKLEIQNNNNQILYQDKSTFKYRLFFKPLQFSGTPNNKTFELLEKIKKLEKNNYRLLCNTINKYGICRNYLDLLAFEHYILCNIEERGMFHDQPLCLTKSGIPILLTFVFDLIENKTNIEEIDEEIKTIPNNIFHSKNSVGGVRLCNVYNHFKSSIDNLKAYTEKVEKERKKDEELKEKQERIAQKLKEEQEKEVKETENIKYCLNCGEKLKNKKPVKKFCDKYCYFEFRKKNRISILNSEEPIVEELETEDLDAQDIDTQKSDFNPFEKPVTKSNYKLNNENIKQEDNFDLHNNIDLLKDETILSIADYLNQKNESLYQKIESSIKTQFDFVESMFKIRIDEVKDIQSEIDSDRNFISSELIVFQKSIKEIEVNHKKSINQIKILSFINVIILILIIFFLLIDK